MKRILAAIVAAAVAASIAVAGVGASAGADDGSSSSDGGVAPVLAPPAGQTAVKGGDRVTLGGAAPAGSTKSEAFLRVLNVDGEVEQQLNVTPQTSFSGDGQISGSYVLPALDADGDHMVYVVEAARADGSVARGTSNPVPVDLIRPQIDRYELVGLKRVRVVFSEPVWSGFDNPLDWRLENHPEDIVLQVTGSGAERFLHLDPVESQDEDSTPNVTYIPDLSAVTKVYFDRADNKLGAANRPTSTALDRIPPLRIPEIEAIGGKAPGSAGTDATPDILVGEIRDGHVAEIYEEVDGEPGLTEGDPLIGEAAAGESGAVVTPDEALDPDGEHVLHVAARDPAGNRTAGDTASYVLDRVAPLPEYAALIDATHIEVVFTEPLLPEGGNAAAWTVTEGLAVTEVTGTGDRRILTLAAPASPEAEIHVSYAPADGFTDAAGNALAAFGPLRAFNGIPPVLDVTVPLSTTYTPSGSEAIHGVSQGAEQVEIHADAGDGTPAGDPIGMAAVSGDGSFQAMVPLAADTSNDFLVRGLRDEEGHLIEGPYVDVPAIVQDSQAPELELVEPGAGPFAGGSTLEVRWNASDANFGPGPIRIERNLGSGWKVIEGAGAQANDGSFEWTLPMADTESARIRVTATDRVGHAASRTSAPFEIDSTPPRFDATTVDDGHITVRFTEPVSGQTAADEWGIDRDGEGGEPSFFPVSVQRDGGAITELTLNTLPNFPIRANDTPFITYRPAGLPLRPMFRDAAGNRVTLDDGAHVVVARDGIIPLPPEPESLPSPVDRNRIRVTGTSESGIEGQGNEAIVRRVRPGSGAHTQAVAESGAFSISARLVQNKKNVYDVSIQDPSGNVSPTRRVWAWEDSLKPKVTVKKPKTFVRANRRTLIRWKTRERHKDFVKIRYQYTAGGKKKSRMVALRTPDDGRFRWKAPGFVRGKQVRFRVIAVDQVGHRGADWGPWLRGR